MQDLCIGNCPGILHRQHLETLDDACVKAFHAVQAVTFVPAHSLNVFGADFPQGGIQPETASHISTSCVTRSFYEHLKPCYRAQGCQSTLLCSNRHCHSGCMTSDANAAFAAQ